MSPGQTAPKEVVWSYPKLFEIWATGLFTGAKNMSPGQTALMRLSGLGPYC